jgi:hypothetical protein
MGEGMNRLPSNLVGRGVSLILNSGKELGGKCTMASESYLILRIEPWEWTVEAEEITAIGVNREGEE